MAIWSQLPDEIIKNVCAYWCPRKEQLYRRIWTMTEMYDLSILYCSFGIDVNMERKEREYKYKLTGKDMLKKLLTLPIPDRIRTLREREENKRYVLPVPSIKITKKLCHITHWKRTRSGVRGVSYYKKIQFNFEKNPTEYSSWLKGELVTYFKDLYEHWTILFEEEHPKIYRQVEKNRAQKQSQINEKHRKIQFEESQKHIQQYIQQLKIEKDRKIRQELREQIQAKKLLQNPI